MNVELIDSFKRWKVLRIEHGGGVWWKLDRGEGLPFRRCGTQSEALCLLAKIRERHNLERRKK